MHLEISKFKNIVVLTGAGISAESGISTFRDSDGLWEKHRIEDVATPEAFDRDPVLVWRFYSMRRRAAGLVQPNPAHTALADFGRQVTCNGKTFTLVTQNVDMLHERSNSSPIAMHGTLSQSRCIKCDQIFQDLNVWFDQIGNLASTPAFSTSLPQLSSSRFEKIEPDSIERDAPTGIPLSPCCRRYLRPNIVWFGEMPLHMDQISEALQTCDLFVTIGSSGQVYPAAGFIEQAKIAGAVTACLNKERLPQQGMVDFYLEGPATKIVPTFFQIS